VVSLLLVLFVLGALLFFGLGALDTGLPLPRFMERYRFGVSVENPFHRWSTASFGVATIFLVAAIVIATSS
jgi:hypothetical protein